MAQKSNFAGVPFKTLLDKGHKEYNLAGVDTEILQFPCAENGMMAVFRAVVKNTDGATFSAHGDADPHNTTEYIVPHLLRMAETRAIARALRWLTNEGETAKIEISGDEDESDPIRTQQTPPDDPPVPSWSIKDQAGNRAMSENFAVSTALNPESAKEEFLNRSKGFVAKIADEDQVAIVLTTCGYDDLDQVKPQHFRRVYDALKEECTEIEEKRAATKMAADL